MYAILKHGGHQYRVSAGDRLLIDRIPAEIGSTVTLEPVLLIADGDAAEIGSGAVSNATVTATVLAHRRGRKLRVFTYKAKKRRRRTLGYRSQLTELRVEEVRQADAARPRRAERHPAEKVEAAATPPETESPAAKAPARKPAARATAKAVSGDKAKPAPAAKRASPRRTAPKQSGDGA